MKAAACYEFGKPFIESMEQGHALRNVIMF